MKETDFLIIGSGVAGLSLAVGLSRYGRVAIITKKELSDSNTNVAQGGIASVLGAVDSFSSHIDDTLAAGAGLCRRAIVEMVVRGGPRAVERLESLGVPFSRRGEAFSLALEGGHSHHRVVHCKDHTGREVERTLLETVHDEPNIEVHAHHMAVNLITERHVSGAHGGRRGVYGAYALNGTTGEVGAILARRTILATGGAGKVYQYTTNPDIATGDGVAMAYRAGARVANLEFVQFHPTCLYHPQIRSFLLSEALRGEGGLLVDATGRRFMAAYDVRAELAPRDIVARAIDAELKQSGEPCVYLDLSHLAPGFVEDRFPSIFSRLMDAGIDMRSEPIPVVPATHYFCGGIDVNERGVTSVPGLLALGEVSHTGLHGANRLASNSLLEALVFAERTVDGALEGFDARTPLPDVNPWVAEGNADAPPAVILEHDWDQARRIMWDYVGIVRSDQRLEIARQRMRVLSATVHALYWDCRLTVDLLELRNIILVGELIIESALSRRESRGLHHTETYPDRDDVHFLCDTLLERNEVSG